MNALTIPKHPSYDNILQDQIDYYGETKAAYEFAATEYAKQMIDWDKEIRKSMPELKSNHIIFFFDIDPDTLFISQMKPLAYFEDELTAKDYLQYLKKNCEEGCREYRYTKW